MLNASPFILVKFYTPMFAIPRGVGDEDLDLHRFSRMSATEFRNSLALGHRYSIYRYTISAFIYSATLSTNVKVAANVKSAKFKGLPYSIISLILGWWFITGPINTIASIATNTRGGIDVSGEILEYIHQQDPRYLYGMR